jgi:hypothetical protein
MTLKPLPDLTNLALKPNTSFTTGAPPATQADTLSKRRLAQPGDRIYSLGYIMLGNTLPSSKTPDTATPSDDLAAPPEDNRSE